MKKILITAVSSAAIILAGSAALYYLNSSSGDDGFIKGWNLQVRGKEDLSRLNSVPILLYHNIDGKGPFSITHETLRSHFEMFRDKKIRVVPLKDMIASIEKSSPLKERSIAITFDDGYKAMYTKLLPLVKEFGYPVTLFVYADMVNRKGNGMTWARLREMQRGGIDIQSHTVGHSDLTSEKNSNDSGLLYREIYLSKKIIELNLQKRVDYFAYPYGRYDLETVEMARRAGYLRTFTTDYGENILTRNNFCIRRHHIKNNFTLDYIEKLIE